MDQTDQSLAGRFKKTFVRRFAAGTLVLLPVGVTLLVLRWLFRVSASFLHPIVQYTVVALLGRSRVQALPESYVSVCVSALAVLSLVVLLYLVGMLGQYIIGRRLIGAWEALWLRIPLARSVYAATRQVMQALSQPQDAAFKSVVLVEFPRPGFKAVGFLTGYVQDRDGKRWGKVLIPTTPNPTTGFLEIVPADEITHVNVRVEEAFKMIISGGIVSPDDLLQPSGMAPQASE